MEQPKSSFSLTGNALKGIAILAMTVDHLTWTLAPGYSRVPWVLLLHLFGRITAPIMWFFIAEGFHYTRNLKKYGLRLFILAIISHFAYNFCFGISMLPFRSGVFNQTGVVWSLAWGLVLLQIHTKSKLKAPVQLLLTGLICLITFPADWSCIAAMAVLFIGLNRGNFKRQMLAMMLWTAAYAIVYFFFIDRVYGILQLGTCLSIPLLALYRGERGKSRAMGKLFYIYYPLHLVLCGILRVLLYGVRSGTGAANF